MRDYRHFEARRASLRNSALGALVAVAMLTAFSATALAQQVLKVTGTGANPPFSWLDPATNKHRGISVDIVDVVAADLGLTVEHQPVVPLGDLEAAINAGTVDAYLGNIPITPARLEKVAMTIPWYLGTGDGVWVLGTDTTDYRTMQDFKGQAIGAIKGSPYAAALERTAADFAEVRLYDLPNDLAEAVIKGEIKGGLINGVTASYTLFDGHYPQLKVPPNYKGTIGVGTVCATPFKKDAPELLAKFNSSLAQHMADGTVHQIFAKYGLEWPAAK